MFLIRAVLLMVLLCRVPGRESSISTHKPSLKMSVLFHHKEKFQFSLELLDRFGPDFDRIIKEVYFTWPP